MLAACAELLGNLLGDWTSDEILDYFSKIWIDKLTTGHGLKTAAKRNGGVLESEKTSKVRVVRNGRRLNGNGKSEVSSSSDVKDELLMEKLHELSQTDGLDFSEGSISKLLGESLSKQISYLNEEKNDSQQNERKGLQNHHN